MQAKQGREGIDDVTNICKEAKSTQTREMKTPERKSKQRDLAIMEANKNRVSFWTQHIA